MSLIQELKTSVFRFDEYPKFLRNTKGRVARFGIFLVFLFWLFGIVVPFAVSYTEMGGIDRLVRQEISDFRLENGSLFVEKPIHYEDTTYYIDVNTGSGRVISESDPEVRRALAVAGFAVIADSRQAILKMQGEVRQFSFDQLSDVSFSKQDLVESIPTMKLVLVLFLLSGFFSNLFYFFSQMLIIALIGRTIARSMGLDLSFGQVYTLSVYTRTLPLLIKAVANWIPFFMPDLQILTFSMSLVWLYLVFRAMVRSGVRSFPAAERQRRSFGQYQGGARPDDPYGRRDVFGGGSQSDTGSAESRDTGTADTEAGRMDAGTAGSDDTGSGRMDDGSADIGGAAAGGMPVPTPKSPDGDGTLLRKPWESRAEQDDIGPDAGDESDEAGLSGRTQEQDDAYGAADGPVPTPKTPDGGMVFPWEERRREAVMQAERAEDTADIQAVPEAAETAAPAVPEAAPAAVPAEAAPAVSGAPEAAEAAAPAVSGAAPAAEPAEAASGDITPSDGWSFGSFSGGNKEDT